MAGKINKLNRENKMSSLEETLVAATHEAVEAAGGPVTLFAILKAARPIEGYVRDYRDAAIAVTEVVDFTDYGDPLRVVAS